jgi:hypothetical protein
MTAAMKFDVFGTIVEVSRREDCWTAFYLGQEGKKRPAEDIVIPANVSEGDIRRYLADVRHEYATAERPEVIQLD